MKKFFTLLFFSSAFISNAQRTMFSGQNNYVGTVATATLNIKGLVFNVDVGNSASYVGSGAS